MSYNFSTRDGFLNNDVITSINSQIDAVIAGRTSTSYDNSTLTITFSDSLSESDSVTVYNIVGNADTYVPPTIIPAFLENNSTILKHTINGVTTKYIGQQSNEIHISTEPQGNYSSLKAAITANPGPNHVFIIHPGEYHEDNPIVLEEGTVIYANGNAENTTIIANNPNADLLHAGIKNKIEGITWKGAYGTGCRGIYFNAAASGGYGLFSAVFECFIKDCDIGIEINGQNIHLYGGVPDQLYARELVISATPALFAVGKTSLDKGIYTHSGGQLISMGLTIFGIPPTALPSPALPIMCAYNCKDPGSKISMTLSNGYYCYSGLHIDNDCQTELTLLTLKYNVNGVNIGPNGTQTRLSVNSLEVNYSQMYDMLFQPQSAIIEVHSGLLDDSKIHNPNHVRLNMRYHTNKNGQSRQRMLGVINVGNADEPASMMIGEGSYDNQNTVFTNTELEIGTWIDLTSLANEESNTIPFNLFSNTAINNCLYLGRAKNVLGIKINIVNPTTSITPLNALEWTYWNGSEWVLFSVMQTRDVAPYYYMKDCFISEENTFHIRFGIKSNDAMVEKNINGVSKKWVRVRVVSTLSSVPQSEYIKFHTSSIKVNGDGFTEYFGDSRTIKKLGWNIERTSYDEGVSDQPIYISKKIGTNLTKNKFPAATASRICLTSFIQNDIDNSFPVKLKLAIAGSSATAGDVKFTIRFGFTNSDSDVYMNKVDAPNSITNENVISSIKTISAINKEYRMEIPIDFSGIDANLYDGGPQLAWVSIERDAGVGDDTYTGDVSIIQLAPYYVSWIDGSHLLAF